MGYCLKNIAEKEGKMFNPIRITILLVLALGLCLPSTVATAKEHYTISVVVETNGPIAGVQLDLNFDSSLVSIEEGDLLTQGGASTYFTMIDNSVVGVITSPGQTVSTRGTFAIITLSTEWPVTISKVLAGDIEGKPVPVSVII